MIEQATDNRQVIGSSPITTTILKYKATLRYFASIVKWYNNGFVIRYSQFDSELRHHRIARREFESLRGHHRSFYQPLTLSRAKEETLILMLVRGHAESVGTSGRREPQNTQPAF